MIGSKRSTTLNIPTVLDACFKHERRPKRVGWSAGGTLANRVAQQCMTRAVCKTTQSYPAASLSSRMPRSEQLSTLQLLTGTCELRTNLNWNRLRAQSKSG